jgi:hypothetical protein
MSLIGNIKGKVKKWDSDKRAERAEYKKIYQEEYHKAKTVHMRKTAREKARIDAKNSGMGSGQKLVNFSRNLERMDSNLEKSFGYGGTSKKRKRDPMSVIYG